MRFLLDENTPRELAVALRNEGHDVMWIPETGFRGLDDPGVWALGRDEDRAIVTYDVEFPTLGDYPAGMILVRRIGRLSASAQAAFVLEAIRQYSSSLAGQLLVVAPGQVRRRAF